MYKRLTVLLLAMMLILIAPVQAWANPNEEIYQLIEMYYVDEVDSASLRFTDPEELGSFLNDPYTEYYSPKIFAMFLEAMDAAYSGIGVQISEAEDGLFVELVFEGSPAESAGILPGDVIFSVDGTSLAGLPLDAAAGLIKGEPDTQVVLGIRREGSEFEVSVTRGIISVPTVFGETIGDVGYIYIHNFTMQTPLQFRETLTRLKESEPRGYILDLRYNPGGYLDAVLEVAGEILPEGPVVTLRNRFGEEVFTNTADGETLPNLIVLINNSSASAAELLAGAIQDLNTGVLLGEQSYGKASVQQFIPLSNGGALKMTVARYYTPNGQAIDKMGLAPGVPVQGDEEQFAAALQMIRNTSPTLVFGIDRLTAWTTAGDRELENAPFIEDNRSYVPLRFIADAMGTDISWDETNRTAVLEKDDVTVTIPVDGSRGFRNGEEFDLYGQTIIRGDRSFIPARAVAEALGARVWWDALNREVVVAWD
ncbi:MAG: S41 family peptidase [Bacillota bacterium]|nr:S41 family peptidase [Bacillota bacterium]MDW7685197.1 S41 family peptidase [Bacillota bacterium]